MMERVKLFLAFQVLSVVSLFSPSTPLAALYRAMKEKGIV